jgi:hypothetical protein
MPAFPNQSGVTPVVPVLQMQDGSFVGTMRDDGFNPTMVAFNADGSVRWSVPGEEPKMATPGGGVLAQSGNIYDPSGSAIGQRYFTSSEMLNWAGQVYDLGVSGFQQNYAWIPFGVGYWPTSSANPAGNAASVAMIGKSEGLPLWATWSTLFARGSTCHIGSDKTPLSGAALDQFTTTENQLLAVLDGLTPSSACFTFLSAKPKIAPYLSQLSASVRARVPYDGLLSNLSMFAAGTWTQKDTLLITWPKWPTFPVCTKFIAPTGWNGTVAIAQIQSPATDIYVATQKEALKHLSKSTVLHETLHSVTGLDDDDLFNALTGGTLPPGPTSPIDVVLQQFGCVGN